MKTKVIIFFVLIAILLILNCKKDNNKIDVNNTRSGIEIGLQEVYFSAQSGGNSWLFPNLDTGKLLFDNFDNLSFKNFRYTIFWTSVEVNTIGEFDWTRHDELIPYLYNKGLNICITLFGDHYLYYADGSSSYPDHPDPDKKDFWNAWLNYVALTVDRYKDMVSTWELWNEPDLSDGGVGVFWKPVVNAQHFSSMVIETAKIIRQIQPNAVIIMGGVTNFNGYRNFLKECFDNNVMDYIDQVGIHLYRSKPEGNFNIIPDVTVDIDPNTAGIQMPTTFQEEITSLRNFITSHPKYRSGITINNTESGYINSTGDPEDYAQLKYLTRSALVEYSHEIKGLTYFRMRVVQRTDFAAEPDGTETDWDAVYDNDKRFLGLIDQISDTEFQTRPAFDALGELTKYCSGSDSVYLNSITTTINSDTVRIEIYKKNNYPVIAYWIVEDIDDTVKALRYINLNIPDIDNYNYTVRDIANGDIQQANSAQSGSSVTFSNLPITDYPFILYLQ